jgi:hypothetical protein
VTELDQPTSSSLIKAGSVQSLQRAANLRTDKDVMPRTNSDGYLAPMRNSTTNKPTYLEMMDYETDDVTDSPQSTIDHPGKLSSIKVVCLVSALGNVFCNRKITSECYMKIRTDTSRRTSVECIATL